jgi:hypothetical protein
LADDDARKLFEENYVGSVVGWNGSKLVSADDHSLTLGTAYNPAQDAYHPKRGGERGGRDHLSHSQIGLHKISGALLGCLASPVIFVSGFPLGRLLLTDDGCTQAKVASCLYIFHMNMTDKRSGVPPRDRTYETSPQDGHVHAMHRMVSDDKICRRC